MKIADKLKFNLWKEKNLKNFQDLIFPKISKPLYQVTEDSPLPL